MSKKLLYSFFPKYGINSRYLSAVYRIQLSPISYKILLVAYPEGASGLSANTTFGILFDIDDCRYQYFGTWGLVDKNFVDINNDGIFEFVCVDYYVSNGKAKLIANIFSPDISGLYIENNSLEENNIFVLFLDDLVIEKLDLENHEIRIMKTPDIFERDKYYP